MKACKKHTEQPVKGYSECPGCEVESLRDRIADLERQLAELTQENEAICAQNERFAEQLDELLRAQPTAQQVEDARDAAPTLKVLSKDEAHLRLHQAINAIKIGNKTDDKLIFRELRKLGVVLAALQAVKEKE